MKNKTTPYYKRVSQENYNLCQKSLEHSFNKSTLHSNNKFPVYNEGLPSPPPLKQCLVKGIHL